MQSITFPQGDNFTNLEANQIFLNAGENTLEIRAGYGYMDIDYFTVGELTERNIYEAENATIVDANVSNEGSGFSGSGYVVFEAAGTVSINVEVAASGFYALNLGYRSAFGEKIQDLYVNNTLVQQVIFQEQRRLPHWPQILFH